MKIEGIGVDSKVIESFSVCFVFDSDSFSIQLIVYELKFFFGDDGLEVVSFLGILDFFSRFKNSFMEFFRIDSKDSISEFLGFDFGEKLYSRKLEFLKLFFIFLDGDSIFRSFSISESKVELIVQDIISRGLDDLVLVIFFKDVVFDDFSGIDEGRFDFFVNLFGELELLKDGVVMGFIKFVQINIGIMESKLLEVFDVLCFRFSTEQC